MHSVTILNLWSATLVAVYRHPAISTIPPPQYPMKVMLASPHTGPDPPERLVFPFGRTRVVSIFQMPSLIGGQSPGTTGPTAPAEDCSMSIAIPSRRSANALLDAREQ